MKFISNKMHGALDYLTVIIFAGMPTILGLSGTPAYLSYALAAIHFLMTVMTDFSFGKLKIIPLKVHKLVEAIVGPVLVVVPWALGFSQDLTARYAFVGMGIIIIFVGLVSKYEPKSIG